MKYGIDVSSVQGHLDWDRVVRTWPTKLDFAYIRCGVGNDGHDVSFDENVAGARAIGLIVGAYHFLYPLPVVAGHESRDPVKQAQAHFEASRGLGSFVGELPPAVDVEWPAPSDWAKWGCTKESIVASANAYADECERLHEVEPMIYIYPDFEAHLGNLGKLGKRPLWEASYEKTPRKLRNWGSCVAWQTTGGGGKLYSGAPVDTDVIMDDDRFALLLGR